MLTDIFSALDPATNSFFNSAFTTLPFWMANFIFIFILSSSFWLFPSRVTIMSVLTSSILYSQASRTSGIFLKAFPGTISTLFIMIMMTNIYGLLPYTFSYSSHLLFTMTFGLIMWLSLIISGVMYKPVNFLANLLPGGAPDWLNPFLVLIETTSISVRPLTLSFRLAANMSAGHIILSLMGAYTAPAIFSSFSVFILLTLTQTGYLMFEIGVCLVQAYIFTLLLTLYADDHP